MSTVTRVMSVSLVPADATVALKLRAAIDEMCAADPTLGVAIGPINEIVLQGLGELHLEVAVDILKRGKALNFETGAPEIHYRESITKTIEWDYTHKRPADPPVYAKVRIRFEPGAPGSGFVFENAAAGDAVPEVYVRGVEKGLTAAKESGVVAGFPVIDLKCKLIDGGYHDMASNVMAFDVAARACFREALPKAGPRLLEPMMKVEVTTPEGHMGDVIGDLCSRYGQITGMEPHNGLQMITAFVPLANLFGYPITLSHMTRGGARCAMSFSHYEQIPPYRGPDDDNFPPAVGMRA